MFKPNLNPQFFYQFSLVKMSAFGLLWNLIFHSLVLSILVYWSFSAKSGNFNQFWNENQLLLATLCQGSLVLFFRDELWRNLRPNAQSRQILLAYLLRGVAFTGLIAGGLVLSKQYDFLGFTAQANLTFLSSYAWVFRTVILAIFILCSEVFLHGMVAARMPATTPWPAKAFILTLTLVGTYAIWFEVSWSEALTLALLCVLFDRFWEAVGFLSAFFILSHAGLSLPWMGNEFSGLAQLKESALNATTLDARFFELPVLQFVLFVLVVAFKIIPFYNSRRKVSQTGASL